MDLFNFYTNAPLTDASKERIQELRSLIHHHDRLYYNQSDPEITDAEYDKLFRELEKLEKEHPECSDPNSPTQRVGGTVLDKFEQVTHKIPMLSIDDYFNFDELEEFYNRVIKASTGEEIEFIIEPKIDGVAASLYYEDGILSYCATRGDGARGDDVSANARTINAIPLMLHSTPTSIEIRGEIYLSHDDFNTLNEKRKKTGKKLFANPRNAASGTLKSLDTGEVRKRKLSFIAHGIGVHSEQELDSETQFKEFLEKQHIPTNKPTWKVQTLPQIIDAIKELDRIRFQLGYGTDGAVIKVNSFSTRKKLGNTSRAPRWAAAFKFPPEKKQTLLKNITIQVGRTGVLTPVAELEPVHISGTTVSRATLHNENEIHRKDIRIGDVVIIEKAGEIIPSVVEVVLNERPAQTKPFNLYDYLGGVCPACQSEIVKEEGFTAWKCVNYQCCAQAANKITHFSSRKALDLNGLGESVAQRFVDSGLAKSPLDLFTLTHAELADLELEPAKLSDGTESKPRVYGAKRATNLLESLANAANNMPLSKWIFALGIDHIGDSASKELTRLCPSIFDILSNDILGDIQKLTNLKALRKKVSASSKDTPPANEEEKTQRKKEFETIKLEILAIEQKLASYKISSELGSVAVRSLLKFFSSQHGQQLLEQLKTLGINPKSDNFSPIPPAPSEASAISGKNFVITGTLSKPRPEFKKQIELLNGKVSGAVSKNTDFLLCGEGGGSKLNKAEALGITIINEDEFISLLTQN